MNANKKLSTQWREDEAVSRFSLISPLLDETLDEAKRVQIRSDIAERNGLSVRTIYRYEKAYHDGGFNGLKPKERGSTLPLPDNFQTLLDEAIQLRREVPSRSVKKIIDILELEGKVAPGVLKRSTLQRHLANAGFSERHMRMYKDARKSSSKRFCKPHRMMLVQGDYPDVLFIPTFSAA